MMTTGLQAYRLGRRENCDVCCHSCSSRLSHRFLATSRRFSFLNACAWCMTFGLPSFSSSSSCCKATTLPPTHAYTKDFIHTLSQAVNITIITFSCACRSGCHRCVCVYQLLLARGLLLPYSGPYARPACCVESHSESTIPHVRNQAMVPHVRPYLGHGFVLHGHQMNDH